MDVLKFIQKNRKILAKLNLSQDEKEAVIAQMIDLSELMADAYLTKLNKAKKEI